MAETIVAFVTCGSVEEARRLAGLLVEERLAACVNLVPSVASCYRWEGEVKWDAEHLILIKTTGALIDRVRERVIAEHSYDLPEFLVLKVDAGSAAYLDWIADSVQRP